MTSSFRLTPPEPLDLVPAEQVRAMIASTDRELATLEREAETARGAADAAEARAREAGVDGRASTWAMVRMQRFIDGLRSEADRDVNEMLDVARARARARLDDAHAEAAAIRGEPNGSGPPPNPRGIARDAYESDRGSAFESRTPAAGAPVGSATVATLAPPETAVEPESVADDEPGMEAVPAPEVKPWVPIAPVVVEAPVAVPEVVEDESAADDARVDESDATSAPPALLDAPATTAPIPPARRDEQPDQPDTTTPAASIDPIAPLATAGAITWTAAGGLDAPPAPVASDPPAPALQAVAEAPEAAADATADKPQVDFWQEPAAKPKKGWRRIPVSAVLEVIAVLLILVFILLRLS
jgi:hypothetical protein